MPETKLHNRQLPDTIKSKTIDSTNTISTDLTKLSIAGGTNGQVLSTNGSGSLSWATAGGGGAQIQVDTFTSSGTWTKPSFAKKVEVYLVGGGAGGGSGSRQATTSARIGGVGGIGGSITWGFFNASDLGATESVTVAAGGTGGASVTTNNTNGNIGGAGGTTQFGSRFQAPGGSPTTYNAPGTNLLVYNPADNMIGIGINPPTTSNFTDAGLSDFTKSGGGTQTRSANITTAADGYRASSSFSDGTKGYYATATTGAAGGTNGGNGADGSGSVSLYGFLTLGNGGGGGSYRTGQATGRGGDASNYGAGGGGGAPSDNGFASGRGGNGSSGLCVVISIG